MKNIPWIYHPTEAKIDQLMVEDRLPKQKLTIPAKVEKDMDLNKVLGCPEKCCLRQHLIYSFDIKVLLQKDKQLIKDGFCRNYCTVSNARL
jgi:hypothetical protein